MKTKENILTQSFQLFINEGYKEVSIQNIVSHCGISKGAFYHHFKSKNDLYEEVLNRFFFNYFNESDFDYSQEKNLKDKLGEFVEHLISPYEELLELTSRKDLLAYFRFLFQSAASQDSIQYKINRHFYKKGYYLELLLKEELKQQNMAIAIDAKKTARLLLSIVLGMTVLDGIYDAAKIKSHLHESLDIMIQILVKKEYRQAQLELEFN
ncbi:MULTISPECIES: TetR/AcrR family transcriptional regulator [unclassified Lentimicrobium]|uniref:TetR/AcrR family transcriptional regulator n=1 Tax=unclassified Lentimicrobium TaxID=2677434 RepID=UPI0015562D3F|nr:MULTISPECIES: TetR/AcrR family transcriptional regulator [unclassified Lentimicrobium]NPD45195.1 TetR/AcrR family transcriptional regulator [Lentimicrobium sp. S6]NPD84472.1 TetR/AcrR family transcriptional regulator [Lentimicrobium sp. L6]